MKVSHHPDKYWRYSIDKKEKLFQITEETKHPLVTKTTKVTSLGSCFADHIRMFLKDGGYNYVVTEPNDQGSSANWGRVYNPVTFQQIIDYCNDSTWCPNDRWWFDSQGQTLDPYRAISAYEDTVTAENDFQKHRVLAREVFAKSDVVMITYGLAEVWESIIDNYVFHSRPTSFDSTKHRFRVLEYPECLQAIESACAGIRLINPHSTIIMTVSPVPLRATFRSDVPPVTANAYSKAVLLASVQTAVQKIANAFYFPSYEIVTECVDEPFRLDISIPSAVVNLVMQLFERRFVSQ